MHSINAAVAMAMSLLIMACGAEDPPGAQSCDEVCQDRSAARALRETLKVIYNLTLQGKPVGEQDFVSDCPLGGTARVLGVAFSNPIQGANEVDLVYLLENCAYLQRDDEPEESYDTIITTAVSQKGIMAVQPTATTALIFESDALIIDGSVFDPAIGYSKADCSIRLAQNGDRLSGSWCGRAISLEL
jgi:hypothetical protein